MAEGEELRFVLATGGPLPENDGQKSGAVISLRDITQYRYAMKNIERQQNFLSDVLDSIPNLITAYPERRYSTTSGSSGRQGAGIIRRAERNIPVFF